MRRFFFALQNSRFLPVENWKGFRWKWREAREEGAKKNTTINFNPLRWLRPFFSAILHKNQLPTKKKNIISIEKFISNFIQTIEFSNNSMVFQYISNKVLCNGLINQHELFKEYFPLGKLQVSTNFCSSIFSITFFILSKVD